MAKKAQFDYDLIVIGSGAAGSTAALGAAKSGKKVALCEAGAFGGESPNWGDIPTKALLHAALLYDEAKRGTRFGLRASTLGYNYPAMLQWRDTVTKRTGAADNRRYYEKAGVDTYTGLAHFLSPNEISVNRTHLTAKNFLIATGSHFAPPDVYGIETIQYKTPRTLLDSLRPPRSLFIVGSDSESLEYAQLMATLGTKVYLSEKSARLLPEADSEVGELMERYLSDTKSISCLTQTQVIGVEKKGLGVRVTYTRGETSRSVQVDDILFMTNRLPSTDLGLENALVDYNPAGIKVNEFLQTSAKHIFAAGDVLGGVILGLQAQGLPAFEAAGGEVVAEALKVVRPALRKARFSGEVRVALQDEPLAPIRAQRVELDVLDMAQALELLGLRYVGSRPAPCRVAWDKPVAKAVVGGRGIHTPSGVALPHETFPMKRLFKRCLSILCGTVILSSGAMAAEPASCQTVRMGVVNWTDVIANATKATGGADTTRTPDPERGYDDVGFRLVREL